MNVTVIVYEKSVWNVQHDGATSPGERGVITKKPLWFGKQKDKD